MLSTLELRNIIESSFLPQRCQCTQSADQKLTVRVFGAGADRSDFTVTGINLRELNSSRAISNLIAGLRRDLSSSQVLQPAQQRRYAAASA
ncbi:MULTISPECIES: DUF1652 domain-containing protein [Pseudomonas]|uniref:DUF1652 domain-containing protein n=1 Tax=Pseudomonas quercus TaxID=2722792 RepID=A0ABX0Y8L3_9PSED|nr:MULTISPECIES: DUF1652 domain-containing protein [Pseudomonas]MBF7141120.1 DUF1652 domain-containing protein [Pseudomonas sp. LY10J]NJO99654.1 DUF1652 domain-containing protein [Pseudomonas quercus]